jgi:hypothetical protein
MTDLKYFHTLSVLIIIIISMSENLFPNDNPKIIVKEFIGINSNVGAYDHNIIGTLAKAAKWMREYHRWEFFEQQEDIYGWDNFTPAFNGNAWPYHTKYIEECLKNNIKILCCVERSTEWASTNGDRNGPPYRDKDGTHESHYLDKAEFLAQLVARYGSQLAESGLVETSDKLSGLNYIHYYEDENEPDQWWWQPTWPADKYARYLNAVHDGYNCQTSDSYPLLGIKTTDSTAVHVLGGLIGDNISYLNTIIANTGGRIPFDVLNFHHYCTSNTAGTPGKSPENLTYGFKLVVQNMLAWRDEHAPGMPVWCTEFGWDTYQNDDGNFSYVYAPEQAQANYLLRSIFLLMGYGLEKAFIFFDTDPNSQDITQFSSSGILTDYASGARSKISYYYLVTLQNTIGEMIFDKIEKYREGDPELFSYRFLDEEEDDRYCYVIWCREKNSKVDNGTVINNYPYTIPGLLEATLIKPVDKSETGEAIEVTVNNAGAVNANVIIPQISETPVFLFVKKQYVDAIDKKEHSIIPDHYKLRVYPNPFNPAFHINFNLIKNTQVDLRLYTIEGCFIRQLASGVYSAGEHQIQVDVSKEYLSSGVYLVSLNTGKRRVTTKVVYLK